MQNKNIRTIPLGAATVTVINAGDMLLSLAEVSNVPESEWRPRYSSAFERPLPFPSQSIHITFPGPSLLVDPNNYALSLPPGPVFFPPGYHPPPHLPAQPIEISRPP